MRLWRWLSFTVLSIALSSLMANQVAFHILDESVADLCGITFQCSGASVIEAFKMQSINLKFFQQFTNWQHSNTVCTTILRSIHICGLISLFKYFSQYFRVWEDIGLLLCILAYSKNQFMNVCDQFVCFKVKFCIPVCHAIQNSDNVQHDVLNYTGDNCRVPKLACRHPTHDMLTNHE